MLAWTGPLPRGASRCRDRVNRLCNVGRGCTPSQLRQLTNIALRAPWRIRQITWMMRRQGQWNSRRPSTSYSAGKFVSCHSTPEALYTNSAAWWPKPPNWPVRPRPRPAGGSRAPLSSSRCRRLGRHHPVTRRTEHLDGILRAAATRRPSAPSCRGHSPRPSSRCRLKAGRLRRRQYGLRCVLGSETRIGQRPGESAPRRSRRRRKGAHDFAVLAPTAWSWAVGRRRHPPQITRIGDAALDAAVRDDRHCSCGWPPRHRPRHVDPVDGAPPGAGRAAEQAGAADLHDARPHSGGNDRGPHRSLCSPVGSGLAVAGGMITRHSRRCEACHMRSPSRGARRRAWNHAAAVAGACQREQDARTTGARSLRCARSIPGRPIWTGLCHGSVSITRSRRPRCTTRMIQVGLRSPVQRAIHDWTARAGTMGRAGRARDGSSAIAARIREVVGRRAGLSQLRHRRARPRVCAPPAPETPEIGGLANAGRRRRSCAAQGLNFIAMDLVEVAPAYDVAEITALAANDRLGVSLLVGRPPRLKTQIS